MQQSILRRFALQNAVPCGTANVRLFTEPGAVCRQIIFAGLPPEAVDSIEVKVMNLPIVDVRTTNDWETGETVTAGQHMAMLNGLAGLHLAGGAFSVVLGDEPGKGLCFDYDRCCMLYVGLNRLAPVNGRWDIALLCSRG